MWCFNESILLKGFHIHNNKEISPLIHLIDKNDKILYFYPNIVLLCIMS